MALWLLAVLLPSFALCWYNMVVVAERALDGEEDPLCSCEYVKPPELGGNKAHLLDVMDDFEDCDEWFHAGCCTPGPAAARAALTLEHHARVPWIGGSKQIPPRYIPLALAPGLFYLGTAGRWLNLAQTLTSGIILAVAVAFSVSDTRTVGEPGSGFLPCWLLVDHVLAFAVFVVELRPASPLVLVASIFSFAVMVGLHVAVRRVDPGSLKQDEQGSESLQEGAVPVVKAPSLPERAMSASAVQNRPKCDRCGIVRPPRAKHCRRCDRCVAGFDHHCPALDACVAQDNHRLFVAYLAVASANAAFLVSSAEARECTHLKCPLGCAAAARSALWLAATGPLLATQLWQVVWLGLTTNERLNRGNPHYEYLDDYDGDDEESRVLNVAKNMWFFFVLGGTRGPRGPSRRAKKNDLGEGPLAVISPGECRKRH